MAMFRSIVTKGSAIGLLLGVVVGAAGAQVVSALQLSRFSVTGPFTVLEGETANFRVARDSRSPGPVATVLLRLFDQQGAVVARKVVSLAPGQSAELTHQVAGLYHGEAEVYESLTGTSDRGVVESTVEVGNVDDLAARIRFVCSAGENLETGRQ